MQISGGERWASDPARGTRRRDTSRSSSERRGARARRRVPARCGRRATRSDTGDHHRPVVTATPIKHLVVIFDENVSFDHYFGTYPNAANTDGTPFTAARRTRRRSTASRRSCSPTNPNAYNPTRLTHAQALTCDQNHGYGAEQKAYDGGKADQFVAAHRDRQVHRPADPLRPARSRHGLLRRQHRHRAVELRAELRDERQLVQHTVFGPSTPGALNLVSGQTHGVQAVDSVTHLPVTDALTSVRRTPTASAPSSATRTRRGTTARTPTTRRRTRSPRCRAQNIGDLLNERGVTWGWFQGGFAPTVRPRTATPSAARRTTTSAATRSSTTARTTTRSSTTRRRRTRTTCRRRRSP